MCTCCGDRQPGRRFAVDGSDQLLCGLCLRDEIRIAWSHELVARVHRAAHGYDSPCPTCDADPWLAQQRLLEDLEMSAERARADAA